MGPIPNFTVEADGFLARAGGEVEDWISRGAAAGVVAGVVGLTLQTFVHAGLGVEVVGLPGLTVSIG